MVFCLCCIQVSCFENISFLILLLLSLQMMKIMFHSCIAQMTNIRCGKIIKHLINCHMQWINSFCSVFIRSRQIGIIIVKMERSPFDILYNKCERRTFFLLIPFCWPLCCFSSLRTQYGMVWDMFGWPSDTIFVISASHIDGGIQAPIFFQEPLPRLMFSNDSGSQISCSAHGNPTPTITWVSKDGTIVTPMPGLR